MKTRNRLLVNYDKGDPAIVPAASFGLDVRACPNCAERLKFVEVVLDRKRLRALLEGLALWTEQLPLHPPRGPPDEHERAARYPKG